MKRIGVYFLYDDNDELIYIGKSKNLDSRIVSSCKDKEASYVRVAETKNRIDATIYETYYITKFKPQKNVVYGNATASTLTLPELEFSEKIDASDIITIKKSECECCSGGPIDILRLRKKRGWSQQDLADKLEMHVTSINRMENGKQPVDKRTEIAIKCALTHKPCL